MLKAIVLQELQCHTDIAWSRSSGVAGAPQLYILSSWDWGGMGSRERFCSLYSRGKIPTLPARTAICAISAAFCTHLICTIKGERMIPSASSCLSPDENTAWGSRSTPHQCNFILKLSPWEDKRSVQSLHSGPRQALDAISQGNTMESAEPNQKTVMLNYLTGVIYLLETY